MSAEKTAVDVFKFLAIRSPQQANPLLKRLYFFGHVIKSPSGTPVRDVNDGLDFIKEITRLNSSGADWSEIKNAARNFVNSNKYILNIEIVRRIAVTEFLYERQSENFNFQDFIHDIEQVLSKKIGDINIQNISDFINLIERPLSEKVYTTFEDILWQLLYALTIDMHGYPSIREQVIQYLRIINLLEIIQLIQHRIIGFEFKIESKKDLDLVMSAIPLTPKYLFQQAIRPDYVPETFESKSLRFNKESNQYETIDENTLGLARPLGIGDLKVVKQILKEYQNGEIAHIENILKGEYKERKHRRLDRTEETYLVETEKIIENEKDLQSTERFELQNETQKTIQSDTKFDAGIKVTAAYGVITEATVTSNYATHNTVSESNKIATGYAKDIVSRSVSKIMDRVREERTIKTIREIEETNTHGVDNKDGTGHIVGIYRWVDKIYTAQVVNYGKRMMYEFIVPEPAAFFIHAQETGKATNIGIEEPVRPKNPDTGQDLLPEDISRENYSKLAVDNDVFDARSCPIEKTRVGINFSVPWTGDKTPEYGSIGTEFINTSYKIIVPPGYRASHFIAHVSARAWQSDVYLTFGGLSLQGGGGQVGPNSGEALPCVFSGTFSNTSSPLTGEIPITLKVWNCYSYTFTIEVDCELLDEEYKKWKMEIFKAIMTAYQKKKAAYDEQLAVGGINEGVKIQGRNPDTNRFMEKQELKKSCVSLLRKNILDNNSIISKASDAYTGVSGGQNYPEINKTNLIEQGSEIQFFEQVFEWEQITYLFYPYFWGRRQNWVDKVNMDDVDPLFAKFLQSGAARVVVPVRPGYEPSIIHYLTTGRIWNGGDAPVIEDEMYVSIIAELKSQADNLDTEKLTGEEWEVKMPTSLVILQESSNLNN